MIGELTLAYFLVLEDMPDYGKSSKSKASAVAAKNLRPQELSTSHTKSVVKKTVNLIPLVVTWVVDSRAPSPVVALLPPPAEVRPMVVSQK